MLLDSVWDVVAGRRRRVYRVTPAGEAAPAEQTEQWRRFSGSMARVLGAGRRLGVDRAGGLA